MSKQRLVLILGTILALITAFLVKAWMEQQRDIIEETVKNQGAQQQAERVVPVLVAKTQLTVGSSVDPEDVETKSFPENQVPTQAISSLDRIQGMVVIADIFPGEPITITKLSYPRGASGLAEATPVGRRAITISVDNIAAVAGMVKPGNYVDIIVIIAVPVKMADGTQMTDNRVIPLFQNVEVLAVGQDTVGAVREAGRYKEENQGEEARSQTPLITVSLTPQEASILAYISEQGKIRLVLRNPSDNKMERLEITDLASLFRYLSPQQQKTELPQPSGYVEVYRGPVKERVPLRD